MRRLLPTLLLVGAFMAGLLIPANGIHPEAAPPEPTRHELAAETHSTSAYDPANDPWYNGYRTPTKTLCIEPQGTATVWPWTRIAVAYQAAGLHTYVRNGVGGCADVAANKKVIVRTFNRCTEADGRASPYAYTLVWRWDSKTGTHTWPYVQKAEIWLNLTSCRQDYIDHRTGIKFTAVPLHETGHVFGLGHTTLPGTAMSSDRYDLSDADVTRLTYLYQYIRES